MLTKLKLYKGRYITTDQNFYLWEEDIPPSLEFQNGDYDDDTLLYKKNIQLDVAEVFQIVKGVVIYHGFIKLAILDMLIHDKVQFYSGKIYDGFKLPMVNSCFGATPRQATDNYNQISYNEKYYGTD